jgi:hypothetical protein
MSEMKTWRRQAAKKKAVKRVRGLRAKAARLAAHGERPPRSRGAEALKRARHENRHQDREFEGFPKVDIYDLDCGGEYAPPYDDWD